MVRLEVVLQRIARLEWFPLTERTDVDDILVDVLVPRQLRSFRETLSTLIADLCLHLAVSVGTTVAATLERLLLPIAHCVPIKVCTVVDRRLL